MPYQRSGRDYGPGSIGGTTKYSSRKQASIGVPDRNTRKKAPKPATTPVQPAQRDPGVAGVPGGLTGRGQNRPALTDPGVLGVPGGVTGRQAPVSRMTAPSQNTISASTYRDAGYPSFNQSYPSDLKTTQPSSKDPGVLGTPGGLTGRGQNNPALTDPGVMGVPGGVTGRQAPGSRMTSSARNKVSPSTYSDPGYPSFNQSYPSDWTPPRPRLDPEITHRGRSEPVRVRTKPLQHPSGGPINSFPWTTDHPLVQANLTKARFEAPETFINAQDWPTYFNPDDTIARSGREMRLRSSTIGPGGIRRLSPPDSLSDGYTEVALGPAIRYGIQQLGKLFGRTKPRRPPAKNNAPTDVQPSQNQLNKFQRMLDEHGSRSLERSRRSIERQLKEHREKLDKISRDGGYRSSVETEIRNFERELEAIKQVLGDG